MTTVHSSALPASAASIFRYLGGTGCALWVLFMVLQPDVGFIAPWLWMAVFWGITIGSGLTTLQLLLYCLSRLKKLQQWPLWLLVTASGILGSMLLTPFYWLLGDVLMPIVPGFEAVLDHEQDALSAPGFSMDLLVREYFDLVGPATASWLLISLPRLQGLLPPVLMNQQDVSPPQNLTEQSIAEPPGSETLPTWRQALPKEMGDDVIAVSSELQYLRVWTTRGSTLILGALQEVEDTEATAGMRVHRSWWVHAGHVRGVRRRAGGLVCQLSDGREIPVSRRRKSDVLAQFGDTARYETSAPPPPDSDKST
jgi:hypothetical protein